MSRVDLAIIIVEHDCADLLRRCLRSIVTHTRSIACEIVVISNGPVDPDVRSLEAEFPGIYVIRTERNEGFAAANNAGLHCPGAGSRGSGEPSRYVVLLNPDTMLHGDALGALVRFMDAHPDVGAAGPQLVQPDGRPQPYSHGDAPSPFYLLRRLGSHLRGTYLHEWGGSEAIDTGWVAGTCMIVRRDAIRDVGLLDEQLFLYFEDVDWCLRMRAAGWRVVFVPSVAITHLGGGSIGGRATQHYDRSLVRFYAKWYGGLAAALVWWALRLYRGIRGS
jgi:N-acetylglucosaminyl-diphospho-decaprenol L-rhamnosyltransferase